MCSYADTYGDIFAKRLLRCESVNEIGKERIHSPTDETAFQPNLAMSQANFSFSLKFCNNSFPQSSKSIESSELNAVLTFFFAAFELANNSSGSGRSLATFLFFEHGTDISHYSCHNSVYWLSLTKLRCSREHISLTKNTMRNACSQIGQHMAYVPALFDRHPCGRQKKMSESRNDLPLTSASPDPHNGASYNGEDTQQRNGVDDRNGHVEESSSLESYYTAVSSSPEYSPPLTSPEEHEQLKEEVKNLREEVKNLKKTVESDAYRIRKFERHSQYPRKVWLPFTWCDSYTAR